MPAAAPPPQRAEFASSDPAEVREVLARSFGSRLRFDPVDGSGWNVAVTTMDAGSFTSAHLTLPADLAFTNDGQEERQVVQMLAEGNVEYERRQSQLRYGPGDTFLGTGPGVPCGTRTHGIRTRTIAVRQSALAGVAAADPDHGGETVKFTSSEPLRGGAARWRATIAFIDDLLADHAAATSPLLVGESGRLLAATMLAVFPSTAAGRASPADRCDAHPGTLRRAVAFIDEHAHEDIGIADIARSSLVTVRAVQLAFRRHLGTTPLEYLRQVRLNHAHHDLANGNPVTESVTAVSYRWGFSSPGRFADYYRRAYGVGPGDTLRG